jgi:hypothetical protein
MYFQILGRCQDRYSDRLSMYVSGEPQEKRVPGRIGFGQKKGLRFQVLAPLNSGKNASYESV